LHLWFSCFSPSSSACIFSGTCWHSIVSLLVWPYLIAFLTFMERFVVRCIPSFFTSHHHANHGTLWPCRTCSWRRTGPALSRCHQAFVKSWWMQL
jgi:hypothetical protein